MFEMICLRWIFRPQCGCDLRVPCSSEWGDPAVLLQAPGAEVCSGVGGGGGSMWHGGEVQDHCPRGHQKLPSKSSCHHLSVGTCTQFILYVDKTESAQWMKLRTCNKRPTGLKGHLNSRDHIQSSICVWLNVIVICILYSLYGKKIINSIILDRCAQEIKIFWIYFHLLTFKLILIDILDLFSFVYI